MTTRTIDVAVVGGGLGGLAAAALMARRGLEVTVLERAGAVGGRAATQVRDGFAFNEGAHALYRGGAAARVLGRLGVRWSGKRPPATGLAVLGDRAHALPATLGSLLTTGLLGWSSKVQGAKVMARLGSIDARAVDGESWQTWSELEVPDAAMRAVLDAFVRVATYAHAPWLVSAGATLDQLRLAQGAGVDYVDGGWATLVAGALAQATAAGATVRTGVRVTRAVPDAGGWTVETEGDPVRARAVVLATGPAAARALAATAALEGPAFEAVPLRAACLDVGLSRLPDPRATFALGVGRPLYLSVHSRTARLAPEGCALVSAMKYLAPGEPHDAARDRAELEAWLDQLQPGWREVVVARRWLPAMVTSNAAVTASGRGVSGRPGPRVPGAPGLLVVGDWVGGEGMLLDAALASAEQAADALAADLAVSRVA